MATAVAQKSERWELYRLLADPVRLRLLALTAEDELAMSELCLLLGESQPNVSRHAAPLRSAGLISDRRQGTWTLLRLTEGVTSDPVVADALLSGRGLCARDGTLSRVPEIVGAREKTTREFFSRAKAPTGELGLPSELGAYLAALSFLLPHRGLAVDAGTGDGRCLELLSPMFERVVAVDRSDAQLALCRERIEGRHLANVTLVQSELDGPELRQALLPSRGADVVLAARVLHHAPRPAATMRQLAQLTVHGGALVVIDYQRHHDERLRTEQADLWLGFEPAELLDHAKRAGLSDAAIHPLPKALCGTGPDRSLDWQMMVARKPLATKSEGQPKRGGERRNGARST